MGGGPGRGGAKKSTGGKRNVFFLVLGNNNFPCMPAIFCYFQWEIRFSNSAKNVVLLKWKLIFAKFLSLSNFKLFGSTSDIAISAAWELNSGELNRHISAFCDSGKC